MRQYDNTDNAFVYAADFPTVAAQQCGNTGPTELDVDALAQEIRRIDGSNSLGAGALAEALMPFLSALPASEAGWRDMDSAPKDGAWIIAYRPSKGGGYLDRVVVVRWDDEVSAWGWPDQPFDVYEDDYAERLAAHGLGDHIDPFEDNSFTHWMPLPSAPDRRAGE